jgi:RNA polymerase sigma factor (sigma-70 family)
MDRMHEPAVSEHEPVPGARGRSRAEGERSPRGKPDPPGVASFEPFFEAEHGRLLRALYLVTGNAQEAEELMQDAFVAVWERWDRVGAMEEPTGYLYRTAMNRYRSRIRRAARATRRAVGSVEGGDAFAAADERDAVARALARLPERQRAAIVLTELLGYDSVAAGRILGVKDVTVRSLASQARTALRTELEDRDE